MRPEAFAGGRWEISRRGKTSVWLSAQKIPTLLAPISHDSVVRQCSHATPILRDGEKMIYDRGRIQNPISLLVNVYSAPCWLWYVGYWQKRREYQLPASRHDWSAGEFRDYNWVRIVRKMGNTETILNTLVYALISLASLKGLSETIVESYDLCNCKNTHVHFLNLLDWNSFRLIISTMKDN